MILKIIQIKNRATKATKVNRLICISVKDSKARFGETLKPNKWPKNRYTLLQEVAQELDFHAL